MNPGLWDDSTYLISIYSLNEHLDIDATNILSLLHKITLFIRNRFLNGKTEKNILQIIGFGYAA